MKAKAPKKKPARKVHPTVLRELDRQRDGIYEAQAVVQCVIAAMEQRFYDWPVDVPLFNHALRPVVSLLGNIATAMYEEEFAAATNRTPKTMNGDCAW